MVLVVVVPLLTRQDWDQGDTKKPSTDCPGSNNRGSSSPTELIARFKALPPKSYCRNTGFPTRVNQRLGDSLPCS